MAISGGLSLSPIPVVPGVHYAKCTCMHSFVLCVSGCVISATAESLNQKKIEKSTHCCKHKNWFQRACGFLLYFVYLCSSFVNSSLTNVLKSLCCIKYEGADDIASHSGSSVMCSRTITAPLWSCTEHSWSPGFTSNSPAIRTWDFTVLIAETRCYPFSRSRLLFWPGRACSPKDCTALPILQCYSDHPPRAEQAHQPLPPEQVPVQVWCLWQRVYSEGPLWGSPEHAQQCEGSQVSTLLLWLCLQEWTEAASQKRGL